MGGVLCCCYRLQVAHTTAYLGPHRPVDDRDGGGGELGVELDPGGAVVGGLLHRFKRQGLRFPDA